MAKLSKELFNVSYKDLPSIDAELLTTDTRTTDWDLNARDIISQKSDSETSDCDETDVEDNDTQVCTYSDATSYVAKLKDYAIRNGSAQILSHIHSVEEELTKLTMKNNNCQTKLSDFFNGENMSNRLWIDCVNESIDKRMQLLLFILIVF